MARGKNYMNNNRGVGLQAHSKKGSSQIPCQYGAGCTRPDCIYRHDTNTTNSAGGGADGSGSNGNVCLPYLAGLCTFTNQGCRNYHPTNHAEIQRLKTKYKKIRCRHGDRCRTDGCLYLHPKEMKPIEPNYVLPSSSFPPLLPQQQQNAVVPTTSSSMGVAHHHQPLPLPPTTGRWQQQQVLSPPPSQHQQTFYSQQPPPPFQSQQAKTAAAVVAPTNLPSHSAWKPTLPTNPSALQQQQPIRQVQNPWSIQPSLQQHHPVAAMPGGATTFPQYSTPSSPASHAVGVGIGGSSVWGNAAGSSSSSSKPSFASVVAANSVVENQYGGGFATHGGEQHQTTNTTTNDDDDIAKFDNSGNFNVNAKEFVPSWAMQM